MKFEGAMLKCNYIPSSFFSFPAVGDSVSEDEVVCEIETDKVPLSLTLIY